MRQIGAEEYDSTYRSLHDRLFTVNDFPPGPLFRTEGWSTVVVVDEGPMSWCPVLQAVRLMALDCGESEAIFVDPPRPEWGMFASTWVPEEFLQARSTFILGVDLFGRSGRWAAWLSDENYSVVGAERSLTESLVARLGGLATIREELDDFTGGEMILYRSQEYVDQVRVAGGLEPLRTEPKP